MQNAVVVFDSGVGGLSVLKTLLRDLPDEKFFYCADHAFFPYGNKTADCIQQRLFSFATLLQEKKSKALLIACNTATAAAADLLRAHFTLPIIAMEPAIKPACLKSQNGNIVVLATSATLKSARFLNLCARFGQNKNLIFQECPGLVEAIESDNPLFLKEKLDFFLLPLPQHHPDVIVLGCTHYPWIKHEIAAYFPPNVLLLDTSDAVSRQVLRTISPALKTKNNTLQFATTGDVLKMQKLLNRFGFQGHKVQHLVF